VAKKTAQDQNQCKTKISWATAPFLAKGTRTYNAISKYQKKQSPKRSNPINRIFLRAVLLTQDPDGNAAILIMENTEQMNYGRSAETLILSFKKLGQHSVGTLESSTNTSK